MRFASYTLIFAVALLVGCEKPERTDPKVKAKQRLESLDIGSRRVEVRRVLGKPAGIVSEASQTQVLYSRPRSREIISVRLDDRKKWPAELRVFSKCKLRAPADYFSNGTVRALFVFGTNELVICKEILAG